MCLAASLCCWRALTCRCQLLAVCNLSTHFQSNSCLLAFTQTLQDVSGGKPVLLEGVDLPLWGLEVDVEEGKREFASFNATNKTGDQVRQLSAT
jgi:hypothetical protein